MHPDLVEVAVSAAELGRPLSPADVAGAVGSFALSAGGGDLALGICGMELKVACGANPQSDDDTDGDHAVRRMEDNDMLRTDSTLYACAGATQTPADVDIPMPFGARLLVAHQIAGSPATGGCVSLQIGDKPGGVFVPHHGDGWNIPAAAQTAGYSCIYKNCGPVARLTVDITDGAHTVWYQVLA